MKQQHPTYSVPVSLHSLCKALLVQRKRNSAFSPATLQLKCLNQINTPWELRRAITVTCISKGMNRGSERLSHLSKVTEAAPVTVRAPTWTLFPDCLISLHHPQGGKACKRPIKTKKPRFATTFQWLNHPEESGDVPTFKTLKMKQDREQTGKQPLHMKNE